MFQTFFVILKSIFISHLLIISRASFFQYQGIPEYFREYFEIIDSNNPDKNLNSELQEYAQKMAHDITLSDFMGAP